MPPFVKLPAARDPAPHIQYRVPPRSARFLPPPLLPYAPKLYSTPAAKHAPITSQTLFYTTSVSYSSTFISCLHITQPCTPALRTNEPPGLPNSTGIGYFWALFLMRNLYTPQFISCCTLVCTCSRKLDAVHAGKRSPPRTRCLDYTWQACHLGFDSNG